MKLVDDPRVAYVMHTVERLARGRGRDGEMLEQIFHHSLNFLDRAWTRQRIRALFAALLANAPESEIDRVVQAATEAMKNSLETKAEAEANAVYAAAREQGGGVQ